MATFYQYPAQQSSSSSSSGPYGGHSGSGGGYAYGGQGNINPNSTNNPAAVPQQFPGRDMLGLQNVSPEVLNYGLHAGQNILRQQTDRLMPGVSNFWLSLKYYFSVSLFPFLFILSYFLFPFFSG